MPTTNFRKLEVVAGTVALVAGLIYMFVGVPGFAESGSGEIHPGQMYVIGVHFTYSLESQVSVKIHWTSSGTETVYLYACGQDSTCAHPSATPVHVATGSSGVFNLTTSKGDYFSVEATGDTSISYSGSTPYPFFWVAIIPILAGAALLLFGLLVKPSKMATPTGTVSDVEMSSLIEQLKKENLAAAYVCPSCKKANRITGDTSLDSLKECSGCGAPLDWGDLHEYLSGIVKP